METPLDQERLGEYHKRFADWLGKQGLFFQLRHAGIVEGNSLTRQIGSLMIRFLIVLFVVLGVGYFLLTRHFSGEAYGETVVGEIETSLDLEEIEADGFYRRRGSGGFRELVMKGGVNSFFFNADIEDLVAPFDFLTGISSAWNPRELRIAKAEVELKAGGDDGEMDHAFDTILKTLDGSGVQRVLIGDLSCDWGYSKLTYGRIEGTDFRADLEDGVWKVEISGGTFQQNWMKGFRIVSGDLSVSESGVKVHSLVLKNGNGSLELAGEVKGPVGKPSLNLQGEFEHLPLHQLVSLQGVQVREFFAGEISGSLKISGSTDTRIRSEGEVQLKGEDQITLRERWPILRAISVLDVDRTYRRVDFTDGEFSFVAEGGGLKISNLNLSAGKMAILQGDLETRFPTQEEAAESLGITLTDGFSDSFRTDVTDSSSAQNLEHARMSLSRAAGGGKRISEFEFAIDKMQRIQKGSGDVLTAKERESILLMQEMNVFRINGGLKLAVPAEAFEEYDKLIELYPEDEDGWRWLEIPVDGTFSKISQEMTKSLLEQSLIKEYRESTDLGPLKPE